MNTSVRKGFSVVEIVLVVAVVALGGFIGYRFWGAMNHKQAAVTAPATSSEVAPVTNSKDLDTISQQLDNVDVSGSFEQELDTASSF